MPTLRLRRDGVAWSDLGTEIVILDLRSSMYYSVRDTGAFLVTALMEGASAQTLVERLVDSYHTTEDTARGDVDDFLGEMSRRDLLESIDG